MLCAFVIAHEDRTPLGNQKVLVVNGIRVFVRPMNLVAVAFAYQADSDFRRQVANRLLGVGPQAPVDPSDCSAAGAVVTGHNAQQIVAVGNRTSLHKRRGSQDPIAKHRREGRTVRVDAPEPLDGDRWAVDIFPAAINNASVIHHVGCEVVEVVG